MSVYTFVSNVPGISSRYRFNRGRLSLLLGYQILPAASSASMVDFSYRQPIGGLSCPFHSYIMFGRGFGLVMSLSVYLRPSASWFRYLLARCASECAVRIGCQANGLLLSLT